MIILVGAGGFLGYSLSKYFSLRGVEFATVSRSFQWSPLIYERRYIGSASEVVNFICAFSGDLQVLYMAGSPNLALAEHNPSTDLYVHQSEIKSFLEIFCGLECAYKRFLFVSSGGTVYGDSFGTSKAESSDVSPKSAYGRRNVALENTVLSWAKLSGVQSSLFRVTNPFGPGQSHFRRRGLVQCLVDSASSGQKVSIRGNGYQKRDYLYSDNLCSMIGSLLEFKSLPHVINIASGYSYSAREVIEILNDHQIFPVFEYVDTSNDFEVRDSLVSADLVRSILHLKKDCMIPFKAANIFEMCHHNEEEV